MADKMYFTLTGTNYYHGSDFGKQRFNGDRGQLQCRATIRPDRKEGVCPDSACNEPWGSLQYM